MRWIRVTLPVVARMRPRKPSGSLPDQPGGTMSQSPPSPSVVRGLRTAMLSNEVSSSTTEKYRSRIGGRRSTTGPCCVQQHVGGAVQRVHVRGDRGDLRCGQRSHQEPATQPGFIRRHHPAALEVLGELAQVQEGREGGQVGLHRDRPGVRGLPGRDGVRVQVGSEVLDAWQRGWVGHGDGSWVRAGALDPRVRTRTTASVFGGWSRGRESRRP